MSDPARSDDTPLPKVGFRVYRASRPRLELVTDPDDTVEPGEFMASARATCPYCGLRALSPAGHPRGKVTGIPVCQLPPSMWDAEA